MWFFDGVFFGVKKLHFFEVYFFGFPVLGLESGRRSQRQLLHAIFELTIDAGLAKDVTS